MEAKPILIDVPLRRWWRSWLASGGIAGWKQVSGWAGEGLVPDRPSCSGADKPDALYRGRKPWRPWRAILEVVNPCLSEPPDYHPNRDRYIIHHWILAPGDYGVPRLRCWRCQQIKLIDRPPAHPNCRCVISEYPILGTWMNWKWMSLPPRRLWPEIRTVGPMGHNPEVPSSRVNEG